MLARLEALAALQYQIVVRLDDLGRELVDHRERLEDLDRRLRATQSMALRTYEQGQRWVERLASNRELPDYEMAYAPQPLISVTIPTYNRAETVCERALRSLQRQTYPHWEAIVVGDACTDDTEARIKALGDERIRFENLAVRGPYPDDPDEAILTYGNAPAKRALTVARGQWIAHLDDDDEWDDDHLEVLLAVAQETRAELVYGKWRQRDSANGRLIAREFGEWPPRIEQFAFQAAIYHRALADLGQDPNVRFGGEPGDWNRVHRFWNAGVRFAFVDRAVTTIWFTPRTDVATKRFAWLTETVGYVDEGNGPTTA